MTPAQLRGRVLAPGVAPYTVAQLMDDATSKEWRDWLPETLASYLGEDDIPEQALDKLQAVQVALTNPDVFTEWPLFNHVCVAFNNRPVNFHFLDELLPGEIEWGLLCLRKLARGDLSPEVLQYINVCLADEGVVTLAGLAPDDANVRRLEQALEHITDDTEIGDLDPAEPGDAQVRALLDIARYCMRLQRADKDLS